MKNWYLYILPILMLLPVFLLRDYTVDNELRYLSIADEALRDGSCSPFITTERHTPTSRRYTFGS